MIESLFDEKEIKNIVMLDSNNKKERDTIEKNMFKPFMDMLLKTTEYLSNNFWKDSKNSKKILYPYKVMVYFSDLGLYYYIIKYYNKIIFKFTYCYIGDYFTDYKKYINYAYKE